MGVKKTMNTFFEGMQSGLPSKTGEKIINTAMGPFKWDQLNESWVNVNNGFRLPNISMQDLLLIGYETLSGDGREKVIPCVYSVGGAVNGGNPITVLFTGFFEDEEKFFADDGSVTLSGNSCPVTLSFGLFNGATGVSFSSLGDYKFQYSNQGGAYTDITDSTTLELPVVTIGPGNLSFKFISFIDYIDNPEPYPVSFVVKNTSVTPNAILATYLITD
jgi:hypothetical protein